MVMARAAIPERRSGYTGYTSAVVARRVNDAMHLYVAVSIMEAMI